MASFSSFFFLRTVIKQHHPASSLALQVGNGKMMHGSMTLIVQWMREVTFQTYYLTRGSPAMPWLKSSFLGREESHAPSSKMTRSGGVSCDYSDAESEGQASTWTGAGWGAVKNERYKVTGCRVAGLWDAGDPMRIWEGTGVWSFSSLTMTYPPWEHHTQGPPSSERRTAKCLKSHPTQQ